MSLTRQQRRALCRQAARTYIAKNAKENTRGERRQLADQLANRMFREIPATVIEYEAIPPEQRRIIPVENEIVRPEVVPSVNEIVNPGVILGV